MVFTKLEKLKNWNQRYSASFGGIHEMKKWNKLKRHGGAPPGPRGSAPASVRRFAPHSGLRSAPRARRHPPVSFQFISFFHFMKPPKLAETSGFNLFNFRVSWNHLRSWNHLSQEPKPEVSIYLIFGSHETTQGFKFSCQNIGETIKNFQTTQWNQVTKKKNARFLY